MKLIHYTALLFAFSLVAGETKTDSLAEEIKTRLKDKEIPESFIDAAFAHDSVQIHDRIVERFANPAEKMEYKKYRKIFIKDTRIDKGREFYYANKDMVDSIAKMYGVERSLLLSIAGVESNFGGNHKKYSVFNAYYTIINSIPRRAEWAKSELAEYLEYCYRDDVPVQSVHGSYAGAFGYGQFIPSSFNRFAVDHDKDGLRSHDEWPDVLASMANYLIKHGFGKGSTDYSKDSDNWKGIYGYNHSTHYVRVVIELRNEIESAIKSSSKE